MKILSRLRAWWNRPIFLTEDEIVEDLIRSMDSDDRDSWLAITREEVIGGHHGTGRAIRNHYRLWDPDNPIEDHPDDVSYRIMLAVWDRLHG